MGSNKAATEDQIKGFGLPDVMKTLLDLLVFNAAIFVLGLAVIPAHLVAVSVALGFSLWVNKKFMFGPSLKRRFSQVVLLLGVTAFGVYVLQTVTLYLLLNQWTQPLEAVYAGLGLIGLDSFFNQDFVLVNTAKIAATVIGALSNYILYRNLKFSSRRLEIIDSAGDWLAGHRDTLILTVIMLTAAFARLWQLSTLPPGLHPTEAESGLNALAILNGNLSPFFNGQEGMLSYLQALNVAALGNTVLALYLVPAVIGIAAVLVTYLAAKEWFSVRVALLAAFFMSMAPWALHVSRSGFRASLLMLLVPLLMLFFARALKTNAARWWVFTGVLTGLGFYAHISYYIFPLAILAALLLARWRYQQQFRQLKQPLAIISLSALLVLMPLLFYVFTSPSGFFDRSAELPILQSDSLGAVIIEVLPRAAVKTAAMFHFVGDNDYSRNLGGEPQLNILVGILLVLGLLLSVKRWRDARYFALLAILTVFTLSSVLAGPEAPDAMLSAGAIPIVYILAAIGLVELYVRWKGVFPHNPLAYNFALLIMVSACFMAGVYNYQRYFVAWANTPETYEAYGEQLREAALYMIDNPVEGGYVVAVDEYHDMPISYLTHGRVAYLRAEPEPTVAADLEADNILIIPIMPGVHELDTDNLSCREHESSARTGVVLFLECHR